MTASRAGAGASARSTSGSSVIALLDIVLVSFMAFLPNVNLGVPWVTGFSWKFVNYTILVFPAP